MSLSQRTRQGMRHELEAECSYRSAKTALDSVHRVQWVQVACPYRRVDRPDHAATSQTGAVNVGAATKRGASAARDVARGGKLYPYLLPVATLALGHVAHTHVATSPLAATLAGAGVALSGVALSGVAWLYARPRGALVQWHATVTVGATFVQLVALVAWGVVAPLFWTVSLIGMSLAVSWSIRRTPAIRGEGDDATGDKRDPFGLKITRQTVVASTKDRAEIKVKLGDGGTVEDVQKVLPAIGSTYGTIRKGTRAVAGAREGEATISLAFTDVLGPTLPWPGPTHIGGSIGDGSQLGLAEDSQGVWIYPAGNYDKNIAPGHTGISGMPRSGKGACAHVLIADWSTRRDVARILLVDTRKAEQFTDPIRDAIGWYADDEVKAKRMFLAVERAVTARNKALGQAGYSSWTPAAYDDPALRMPYLLVWLEEAAAYLDLFQRLLVGLGEASLSAGVELVISSQLWKHDRVPTSLRSSIGNVIVFGAASTEDASYLLSDGTIAAGADPSEWKTRHPGRFLLEANGVDVERFPVPNKHFFASKEVLSQVTSTYGPMMAPYDPVTLAAFGEAFEPFAARSAASELEHMTDRMRELANEEPLPEELAGMYGMPDMGDEELDRMMAEIDPAAEMEANANVDGVDLRGADISTTMWTADAKEGEFGRMLEAFAASGRTEIKTAEIHEEWAKRVGEDEAAKRYFVHELLNAWMEAGQIERVTDDDGLPIRGRYRLVMLARVAHGE